jgi:hypothetical protein
MTDRLTLAAQAAVEWIDEIAAGGDLSPALGIRDELAAALAEQAGVLEQEVERAVDAYTSALGTREQRLAAALRAARSQP